MQTEAVIALTVLVTLAIVVIGYLTISRVKEQYMRDDPKLHEIEAIFRDFFASRTEPWAPPLESLNRRNVMDEIVIYRGNTSYTINKEKVYLCMKRDKDNYYDNNMLVYVLAHEIAHVICDEVGHTEKFHTIFNAFLRELQKARVFDPMAQIDENYCKNGDPEIHSTD